MRLTELPLKYMNRRVSEPRQEALDFLEGFSIPSYIMNKYESPEDRADAFDGAITAFQVHAHLTMGASREEWLDEILGWYDLGGQRNFKGPFYDGLHATLVSCGLGGFFDEAIDHILRQEGRLD